MCRDEGGAQRFDVLVAEAGSVFRVYSQKGLASHCLWSVWVRFGFWLRSLYSQD